MLNDFPSLSTGYEVFPGFLVIYPWDLYSSYLSSCLFHQPAPAAQFTGSNAAPLFSCSSPASSFPACKARVVFKTNENGTQEAKWIHLALRYPLPCCYLFLCISLEATFVNMAAEEPQARENWLFFFLNKTNNLSSRGAVLNKAAIGKAEKCKLVSSCIVCSSWASTQRNKCGGAGKVQMAVYRNSWTAATGSSHSQSSGVHS